MCTDIANSTSCLLTSCILVLSTCFQRLSSDVNELLIGNPHTRLFSLSLLANWFSNYSKQLSSKHTYIHNTNDLNLSVLISHLEFRSLATLACHSWMLLTIAKNTPKLFKNVILPFCCLAHGLDPFVLKHLNDVLLYSSLQQLRVLHRLRILKLINSHKCLASLYLTFREEFFHLLVWAEEWLPAACIFQVPIK